MSRPAPTTLLNGRAAAWSIAIAIALLLSLKLDLAALRAIDRLSNEGSPPPALDPSSPTGYADGQRAFLAPRQSGETYRWIARTQEILRHGFFSGETYHGDTTPTGRPQLLPQAYAAWLAAIARCLSAVTGKPLPIAVETVALWEPVVSHALALLAAAAFMGRRFGPASAAIVAALFAFAPWIAGQFLPGVLTTQVGSALFAAYAIALAGARMEGAQSPAAFGVRSALAAALALWLEPALGFPAIAIAALAGVARASYPHTEDRFLRWSLIGAAATAAAWAIDGAHGSLSAGELRYVHPLYAGAWLGLGLALDGFRALRQGSAKRLGRMVQIAGGATLLALLVGAQLARGYWAWLYPDPSLLRLTALEEQVVFPSIGAWASRASAAELVFILAAPIAAALALGFELSRKRAPDSVSVTSLHPTALVLAAALALACFRVHWLFIASLVALPILAELARGRSAMLKRSAAAAAALYLFALGAWTRLDGTGRAGAVQQGEATKADLTALVHRHFSHWLAARTPGQETRLLASPELSDSLIFHGGSQALFSTAWESHPGMVAATRILSAPEANEAEAVLQSRELTHIALSSWETVLPELASAPNHDLKRTLYHRLQHWVLPPYLRPIPYRLPPAPGFIAEKLVLFEVVPHQDDALALSRLAEYFVEVDRPQPAGLAAEALAKSYPADPNAAIARAFVYAHAKDSRAFRQQLEKLEADIAADRAPYDWDRRVLRAIALAMGGRDELAREQLAACVALVTDSSLSALTPLQAFRLRALMSQFGLRFPNEQLAALAVTLSAPYGE